MNPISSTPAVPAAAATTATSSPTASHAGSEDLLAAMNPAMDAAFAVGRPQDASGAAAILSTTGAYISGARATLSKIEDGIELRREQLAQLRTTDPDAARRMEQQVDLLERLRDRIQLSIERVTETLARSGETDPGGGGADDQLEVLEARRSLLAPSFDATRSTIAPQAVARAYGERGEQRGAPFHGGFEAA